MPLHPAIVHLPLGLAVVLPWTILWVGIALIRGQAGRGSWGLVVSLHAMLLVGGLVAAASGDVDAELVERLVDPARVEAHEERAELFLMVAALAGAASLWTWLRIGQYSVRALRALVAATLILSLVTLGQALRVGEAGGLLVYEAGAADAHRAGQASPSSRTHGDEHSPAEH